ncbi:MAG: ribonuclease Y [Holophagales bacterium]|jgi:ribonuclease Y|nr:ribonuclease Y [Holophagales bacterium]
MNALDWVLIVITVVAFAFGFMQLRRAHAAVLHAAKAHTKAETELKAKRERLLTEAEKESSRIIANGQKEADALRREADLKNKEQALAARQEAEKIANERMASLGKQEQRLQTKEDSLDKKLQTVDQKTKELEVKTEKIKEEFENLEAQNLKVKQVIEAQSRKLEEVAGLSREEAKAELTAQLEYTAKMDAAKLIRRIEEEAEEEADRRAKWTITTAIQRIASDVAAEASVTSVHLPSDDLKGRIIGREGRNIRALEKAVGCDLIVDDTPETIVVSSFDPIRREVASQSLQKLIADGRIHPARIEEVVEKVKIEMDEHLKDLGKSVSIAMGFPDIHPKLHKLIGRLNYRTSYGQNVLEHTKEVARIAEYMACEMGADPCIARRAGLFHDIGKAIDREVEGTHIEIGVDMLKRFGEKDEVIHAMNCHHGDIEPRTVEAMLVTAADALSAARPGARREMFETYIRRLEQLEEIATSYKGVQKSYAMQAGREIRIMVDAGAVNDDQAFWLAKDVSKRIESEMQYPGQIKVTVMRETRAVEFAR